MAGFQPSGNGAMPESLGYRLKCRLLGKPLVTEQLGGERLSTPIAVGVLSCDMISSSAYGTEEILTVLVGAVGLAAFSLVLPLTFAILLILVIVTLSYREVVMVYTKAGGSYVVARDNFGPNVAQFAAVALLIDYILTVAVQTAAGTAGITSAFPALIPYTVPICVAVICLLLWGNLRGIREAGRTFAFPTYFYVAMVGLVVGVGLVKAATSGLPVLDVHAKGAMGLGHPGGGLLQGASLFILLRAFANGGASLTGLEAISNSVSALKPPEGIRARRVQVITGTILGALVLGVSILAHYTHAIPYTKGTPTVISQIAKAVFGHGVLGQSAFYVVQLATVMILYTGGNTSFNGFPFLASFVAEDRYLPRALAKRGHRLTFSNGIIVLGVAALALIIVTRAKLDALVSLYAIGVFTGFTMAGSGMVKHHLTHRSSGWRHKAWINGSAAVVSALVVLIFAVTKFTEGAWVVVVLFPLLMGVLIRTNRRYRREAAILGEGVAERAVTAQPLKRHVVFVLVDSLDLATARAVQYARNQLVDDVRAVHFVLDAAHARDLEDRWVRLGMRNLPLELIECSDRRLVKACVQLAAEAAKDGQTEVTVLLPRRAYGQFWGRLLHDRTSERISGAVSRLDHVNATIVPFDVDRELRQHGPETEYAPSVADNGLTGIDSPAPGGRTPDRQAPDGRVGADDLLHEGRSGAVGTLVARQRARVAGRVKSLTVKPWGDVPTLEVQLGDGEETLTVTFLGRRQIAGLTPGSHIAVEGTVALLRGRLTMVNPEYEFVEPNPD